MPSVACQAWICFTQLNSFIYSLPLVTVSVSGSQYLALSTRKPPHTRSHVLVISKPHSFSAPAVMGKSSRERERDWGSLWRWVPDMGRQPPQGYNFVWSTWNLGVSIQPGAQPLPLNDLTVGRVVASTGQFVCHPVHDPRQGEGGPCPQGGGDSQREPGGDDGESADPPGQPFSEGRESGGLGAGIRG